MSEWLAILRRYCYWDFARAFLVERGGRIYLFDSDFDDALDDWRPEFTVYDLGAMAPEQLPERFPSGLATADRRIGIVPVAAAVFDLETRKTRIRSSVFDLIQT